MANKLATKRTILSLGYFFLFFAYRRGESENKAIISLLSLFSLRGPHGNLLLKSLKYPGCKRVRIERIFYSGTQVAQCMQISLDLGSCFSQSESKHS